MERSLQIEVQSRLNRGRIAEAIRLLEHQLSIHADDIDSLMYLARIEAGRGQPSRALALLRRIVKIAPHLGPAWQGLAELELARSNPAEAERAYRSAIREVPADPTSAYNLALMLQQAGRRDEAMALYREALARAPDFAQAHNNLGNLLQEAGDEETARAHYLRAIAGGAKIAQAHCNLGLIAERKGDELEAEACFRHALTLDPSHYAAHVGLARVLTERGPAMLDYAAEHCNQAIRLSPATPDGYNALGVIRSRQQQHRAAADAYARAWDLSKGALVPALRNLAAAHLSLRELDLAARAYEILHAKDRYDANTLMWLIHVALHRCDWDRLGSRAADVLARLRRGADVSAVPPFVALSIPGMTEQDLKHCSERFAAARLSAQPPAALCASGENRPHHPKLRVGYLSADFGDHATSYLLIGVLERHDRSRFELFGYSIGSNDGSHMRSRMASTFDTFRDLQPMTDTQAAQQIHRDEIDILIDLKGWTEGARPEILAHRPAPIIVNWLGYPGSMGHPAYADYIIGDPIVTSPESASAFTEKLALLPHCYQPNDDRRQIGKTPTRGEAGLPEAAFVFCSFNQSYKINPDLFDLWCRLLTQVEGSVLWLLDSAARGNLMREAEARGIAGDRLIFAPKLPVDEHLGRLALADVALDTAPVNSHTTAADALWAGVPLVGLRATGFAGRVSASLLRAAGLSELAAQSPEHYFEIACDLATSPDRLTEMRSRLARLKCQNALFDTSAFTADFESLLVRMWADHFSGPKQITSELLDQVPDS